MSSSIFFAAIASALSPLVQHPIFLIANESGNSFFSCLNFSFYNFFLLQFQLLSSFTRLISYEEKCDKTALPQFWTSKMCDKTKMMNTRHMSDVSVYRSWLILSIYFILPNKHLITLILIICNYFSKCQQLHTMTYRL